ncbi:MAG: hypothetical protein FJ139_05960 [Deltaproteobacteria bacterium]|nr:hypothetical protein [Deltaproteobacteria bacterium]
MKIELIYPFFIFAGLVIIIVLVYLRYLSRKTIRSFLELIDLNARLDFDLHAFLPEALPLLKKIKIEDFFYEIHYLDITVKKEQSEKGATIEKNLERNDYRIILGIVPRHSKGEQYYFNLIILEILALILEMDVLIKIKVIHEALYKFSRLQAFVLHDAKNLAQFIESLSYNVHRLENVERKESFINYLKETLTFQSRRGAKIISLLEMKQDTDGELSLEKTINMRLLLENLIQQYKLQCTIEGEASIVAEEYKVISIFDNIIRNIYDKSLMEKGITCLIEITNVGNLIKVMIADTGSPVEEGARLFEPFYSTKSGGLGIGLFQSKNIAATMKGDIRALPWESGAAFEVVLPVTQHM